jgi:hypothetical protein
MGDEPDPDEEELIDLEVSNCYITCYSLGIWSRFEWVCCLDDSWDVMAGAEC